MGNKDHKDLQDLQTQEVKEVKLDLQVQLEGQDQQGSVVNLGLQEKQA